VANLTRGSDANLYSTTFQGGTGGGGTVFRMVQAPVINSIEAAGGDVTVMWTSFRNGNYRVEYKAAATASAWLTLIPLVTATGGTTSIIDSLQGTRVRLYRVVLLP
jgi:hypothetical protein